MAALREADATSTLAKDSSLAVKSAGENAENLRTETSEYVVMLPPRAAATTAAAAGSALVTSAPTTATEDPLLLILTCPGWNPDAGPEAFIKVLSRITSRHHSAATYAK